MTKELKDDFFNDDNKPQSNWFKFDKIGDRVKGEVVDIHSQTAKGAFPAQKVFALRQENGDIINVGISENKKYLLDRVRNAEIGDTLGFEFKDEVKSQTAGFAAAKSIEAYLRKGEKKGDDIVGSDEVF